MPNTDFYFSRFHILINPGDDKIAFIKKGLNTKATSIQGHFKYKFFQVEDAVLTGGEKDERVLIGSLVKYDPNAQDETVDEEKEQLEDTISKNRVVAKVKFILHLDTNVLAFHESGSLLSKRTFVDRFVNLFSNNVESKDNAVSVSPVDVEASFIEGVTKFEKISKIYIHVVPSNPHFGDKWKKVDEDLKRRNIDSLKEIQETKKNQNGIIIDEETQNKLYMSEDGYGESTVTGTLEGGEEKTISTADKNKQEQERVFIEPNETNQSILSKLIGKINSIGNRASKQKDNGNKGEVEDNTVES